MSEMLELEGGALAPMTAVLVLRPVRGNSDDQLFVRLSHVICEASL